MLIDFVEDDFDHTWILFFELLLQEATTVLVLAHSVHLSDRLFDAREARSYSPAS